MTKDFIVFDPKEFYNFASGIYKTTNQEDYAAFRSIISRAYYGAFLKARKASGIDSKDKFIHQKVSEFFSDKNPRITSRLDALRDQRNTADYDLANCIHKREAGAALLTAKYIIEEIESLHK